ncbi:hypothetical protein QQ045_021829 [Rhodiola kirilowii]
MERLIQERSIWMYNQCVPGKSYCNETFMLGVREFVQFAISRCGYSGGNIIRCPCRKCKDKKHHEAGIDPKMVDNRFQNMISDVAGPSWDVPNYAPDLPDEPNEIAMAFYNLFKSSCDPTYEEAAYNSICQILQGLADSDNRLPKSFNQSKKIIKDLAMGYQRIDVCENGCLIYYAESESLTNCTFCGESRYHPPSSASSSNGYTRVAKASMFYLNIIPKL